VAQRTTTDAVSRRLRKKRKQKLDISAARRSKNAAAGTPLWLKLRQFDLLRDCCGLVVQQVVQQIHNRWK